MKEVWVEVSFLYLKKYAKGILRTILSYILELTTNTLPVFILELTFIVDIETPGKKKISNKAIDRTLAVEMSMVRQKKHFNVGNIL